MPRSTLTWLAALLAACAMVESPASAHLRAAPPAPRTDRSAKLDLIEKLKQSPQILILGDSRGREAEPSFLRRLTGHSGFNAAVTGGSAPDAWVFTRYAEDLFPQRQRRYIWFVSAGLAGDTVTSLVESDPRSKQYLAEVAQYLNVAPGGDPVPTDTHYRPDGSIADWDPAYSPSRARTLEVEAAKLITTIRSHPPVATPPDPSELKLFAQLLAYMNGLGSRPVIVFNPVYPSVLTELEKYGNPVLTDSLEYLNSLRGRYQFVVVNCEDSRAWRGTDYDWTNATHVDRANMRRMLRYIVAHSDGALK